MYKNGAAFSWAVKMSTILVVEVVMVRIVVEAVEVKYT